MSTASPRDGLDKETLYELSEADGRRVGIRVVVVLLVYTALSVLAMQPFVGWWFVVISMVLGFVLSGFINAAHDCVHRSHLTSNRSNRIAGMTWCVPLLLNFTIYRQQHLLHHRYTGLPGDTESSEDFDTLWEYIRSISALGVWAGVLKAIGHSWKGVFPPSLNTNDRRRDAQHDNWAVCGWLIVALVLTIFFPYPALAVYWLPLPFAFSAIVFFSLPEHYGLNGISEGESNTRAVRSNRIVRFFLWNANYHAEHHRFPAVAAVNVQRLRQATAAPQPVEVKSYTRFHLRLAKDLLVVSANARRSGR